MIIGTDLSLSVCKAEGYGMLEYNGRKRFSPSEYYRYFNHWPEYVNPELVGSEIQTDTRISWNDLIDIYNRNKQALDSFADDLPVLTTKPGYYNLLHLADTINAYQGLD